MASRHSTKQINFTVSDIEALPQAYDKMYQVRFKGKPGLRLKVWPSGRRAFVVYRKPANSARAVTVQLGDYGTVQLNIRGANQIGMDSSIEKRYQAVNDDLDNGLNPNKQAGIKAQQDQAISITLKEVLQQYLDDSRLATNTVSKYKHAINTHLKQWADLPVREITRAMVRRRHEEITKNVGPVAANNAMVVLRAVYQYQRDELTDETTGHCPLPANPVITALTPKRKGQKSCWNNEPERHGHIHPDQLEAWWSATEKLASTITNEAGEAKPYYKGNGELGRDYLQFVILTGLRRREAAGLQWQAVDFEAGTFSITENKSHRELVLPMTDYQREILQRRQIATGGKGRVFPIEEPRRLVARVGEICKQHFTVHDLRRSFITYCDIQDIGPTVRKALVNHALVKEGNDIQRKGSGDITDRYVQLDLGRLLAASQLITNYVLSQAKAKPDNVRPFTSAALENKA